MVTEVTRTNDLAASAESLFVREMLAAITARDAFVVALSGGTTPRGLFARLSELAGLPWEKVQVFWGDERFVAHGHADSNYRAARELWLDHLPFQAHNIHPWPEPSGDSPAQDEVAGAATAYSKAITGILGTKPVFDLQLLGLGSDAHTASLYPSDPAISATGLTAGTKPAGVAHSRLTLTPGALSNSRCVTFLVSGETKRKAFEGTLASSELNPLYPARYVAALERQVWLTDLEESGSS